MSSDTTGPAFPLPYIKGQGTDWNMCGGVSVRDYFAAAALNGILANSASSWTSTKEDKEQGISWADKCAAEVFEIADAMAKRRSL